LAEFEELTLRVQVDDQATAKLDSLKRSLADMGSGTQAAGLERLKRHTQDLDETIKKFISQIGEGPRALVFTAGVGRS
jgi:hypothetical protein